MKYIRQKLICLFTVLCMVAMMMPMMPMTASALTPDVQVTTWAELQTQLQNTTTQVIEIMNDITDVNTNIYMDGARTKTIITNGNYTITRAPGFTGNMFTLKNGCNITIGTSINDAYKLTFDGNKSAFTAGGGSVFSVEKDRGDWTSGNNILTIYKGDVINNWANGDNVAAFFIKGSDVNLYNCNITGNVNSSKAAAFRVQQWGTLTIDGANVTNNDGNPSVMSTESTAKFNFVSGLIKDNTNKLIDTKGKIEINMTGGTIDESVMGNEFFNLHDAYSTTYDDSSVNLSGGEIIGRSDTGVVGAYLYSYSKVNLLPGTTGKGTTFRNFSGSGLFQIKDDSKIVADTATFINCKDSVLYMENGGGYVDVTGPLTFENCDWAIHHKGKGLTFSDNARISPTSRVMLDGVRIVTITSDITTNGAVAIITGWAGADMADGKNIFGDTTYRAANAGKFVAQQNGTNYGFNSNGNVDYSVAAPTFDGTVATPAPSPTIAPTAAPTVAPTVAPTATPSPSPAANLALNKPVTVSSIENTGSAGNFAVDGNIDSRWSSSNTDPQWIYIDLGSSQTVNKVVLKWEAAYGKSYKIQVSDDANQWTDVYSTTNGDGGTDNIYFTATTARYIQMYGTVRATGYGYSLWEFEVYNSDEPAPTPTATPTPAPVFDHTFSLYPSNNDGIVDPATGTIHDWGAITGQPTGLIGGSTLNGTNGTAEIYIPNPDTLSGSGTGPCWGKAAVKFRNNGALSTVGAAITYTPTSLNGVDTTVTYNGLANNGGGSAEISALVTYDGGKTATVVCYPYGASAGLSSGALLPPVTVGTYKDLQSVKIYCSSVGGELFLYSVGLSYNGTPTTTIVNGISAINLLDASSNATDTVANAASVGTVKVTSDTAAAGTLIVAAYRTISDKVVMTAVKTIDVTSSDFTSNVANINVNLGIPSGSTSVKAMYWDSLSNLKPIFDFIGK